MNENTGMVQCINCRSVIHGSLFKCPKCGKTPDQVDIGTDRITVPEPRSERELEALQREYREEERRFKAEPPARPANPESSLIKIIWKKLTRVKSLGMKDADKKSYSQRYSLGRRIIIFSFQALAVLLFMISNSIRWTAPDKIKDAYFGQMVVEWSSEHDGETMVGNSVERAAAVAATIKHDANMLLVISIGFMIAPFIFALVWRIIDMPLCPACQSRVNSKAVICKYCRSPINKLEVTKA